MTSTWKQELEAKKCADWSAKKNRIEEASRKKTEMDKEFSIQAKETLTAKMDNYGGNREAIMTDMKDKLKVKSHWYFDWKFIQIVYLLCLDSVPGDWENSYDVGATEAHWACSNWQEIENCG